MAGFVALVLGVVLISLFFLFLYFSLKRFKDSDDKIKYLVTTGIRKRREMAIHGLKPNPPYFRSQLRKRLHKSFQTQIHTKERPSFSTRLAYTFEIYDPVLCTLHRLTRRRSAHSSRCCCRGKASRHPAGAGSSDFNSEREALTQANPAGSAIDLPVPRRHNTPFTTIAPTAKQQAHSTAAPEIPVSLLRPSRWFLVLQYIGGLVIVWFFVMLWLFVVSLAASNVSSFGVFLGIALLAAVFACFFVILFYWYSYRIYVLYIKQSFSKAFYTMLAEPLTKPRPTIGGTSQSLNLFALAQTIREKRQQSLVKSLDLGALLRKSGYFTSRSATGSPHRKRNSEVKYPSPLSSDRKMLDRPMKSQRLNGIVKEEEPEVLQQESLGAEDDEKAHIVLHPHPHQGSDKNLLQNASQSGIEVVKSDYEGQLSRGEFAHIRRNLNFRKQRVLTRGLFYLLIVAILFLVLGLCVVGFFFASTLLAVGSIVGFFFGSLFEIFAVRPLYLLIIACIKHLKNRKKKQKEEDEENEKSKEKKNPLENAELMDEANYLAAQKETKKKEVSKAKPQEEEQLLSHESPQIKSERQDDNSQRKIGSLPENQVLQHIESPPQTRRSGGGEGLGGIDNPPDSPFGTNQSGIPKRDTALFDREEPSFDRAANLLVTPKITTDPQKIKELNHQKIATQAAQTSRRSDGKSGSPLASPISMPHKAQSTQALQPVGMVPQLSVDKSLVQKGEIAASVSGNQSEADGVIEFDNSEARGQEAMREGVLPVFFSERKENGGAAPSKLDKLPDDGEVRREDIPEQADLEEMMMNPLDDLCPYKKMITDIIYLSCGPEGGDQLMKRIIKENDDIPLEDLQRIVEQNNYELVKDEEDEDDRVDVKPEVKPVIPIQETPQEDEEDTNSVPASHRQQETEHKEEVFEVEEAKAEEAKPPEQPEQQEEEQDVEALILAQSPRHFEVPQSLRRAQEDSLKSEEKKYLSQSRKSQGSGVRGSTLSPASQPGRTKSPGASRKSPASIRSGNSRISQKSPGPRLSPRKVLMGAGLAPNTKGRPRAGKDRSLELDLGNMSGSVVISGDRGGQTPPGIQGAEPFFLISQQGGERGYKRGKGKKKKKSRKNLVEYDNGDRENSLEIDGTSVFFKQGQELPVRSESQESFSQGDMVYYNKEDLTNYSRHLGLNKLKGPRFKKVKNMRHSFHPDLSSLSSEEEARRINRSVMHSVSGRPLTYSQMMRRHQSSSSLQGSRRVDCWNRDYEMLLKMGKTPKRRVSRLSGKLSSQISPLRVPVQRNSSFNRGPRQFYSLQPSQQRRGYLPPMSRPKKKKKKKYLENRAHSQIRSSASQASRMWIPQQIETADRAHNLSVFRRPSHMETLSTVLRPGQHNMSRASRMSRLSRGSRQDSDEDELSPYAERMIARFKSWYPGKEDKLKRRKQSHYAKVGVLESLYGGPVEITGIGICGGIRPSQRKKWVKQHKALELQRSHIEENNADDFHPQPYVFGRRQVSHRSSRSSGVFAEPPEASFNPNFYKYYESDSSGDPASNRFRFHPNKSHNSSFSPQQQQRRQKQHSGDTLPSISKKAKRQQFEPLFNPDSTDQKWVGEAHERPKFQSPTEPPALSSSESAKKSSLPPIKSPGSHDSIQEF